MISIKRKSAIVLAFIVAAVCLATPGLGKAQSSDPESWIQSHPLAHRNAILSGGGYQTSSATSRTHVKGVDVSYHNGYVNWPSVKKKNNLKFAIVRLGYSGWTKGTSNLDTQYVRNVTQAHAAGLKVGVYYYSQALTTSEAKREANYVVKYLKAFKAKIGLPVAMDYEVVGSKDSRLDNAINSGRLTKAKATANVKAFYSVIKAAGYTPMLYANGVVLNKINSVTSFKPLWYCSAYSSNCEFFQYRLDTTASGFSGRVDLNYWYTKDLNKYINFKGTTTVSLASPTSSSVKVSWKASSGATRYLVTRTNVASGAKTTKWKTGTSFTDSNLTADTDYTYSVTPYRSSDPGKASNTISVTTASKSASNGSYTQQTVGLTQKKVSSGRQISWTKTYGATKYVVRIYTNGTPTSQPAASTKVYQTATTTKNSYIIKGLRNGTARKVTVTPVKNSNAGKASKRLLTYPAFKFTTRSDSGTNMAYKYNGKYYNSSRSVVTTKVKVTAKAAAPVHIRSKATMLSKSKGIVKKGKIVTVKGCYYGIDDSWTKVTYGKKSGYIKSKYLTKY